MAHEHNYKVTAVWTGNKGDGTKNVRTYDRSHTVSIQGKPVPGYENFGIHLVNGVGIVQNSWDLNYVMYQGESLTSNGVKISLIKSGLNDSIQIERK
jgi:hypothetical protein